MTDAFELLRGDGPYAPHAEKLMLYGQFVGSWDIEATWFTPDGETRRVTGEWHFAWILGGRGVQDVLFASTHEPHQYGTTLRCYDPEQDVWHLTWMQPYGGEFDHLVGRRVGDRIVQEVVPAQGDERRRWSFTEITPASFVWLGEVSGDGGATWFLEQEMRGTRRPGR